MRSNTSSVCCCRVHSVAVSFENPSLQCVHMSEWGYETKVFEKICLKLSWVSLYITAIFDKFVVFLDVIKAFESIQSVENIDRKVFHGISQRIWEYCLVIRNRWLLRDVNTADPQLCVHGSTSVDAFCFSGLEGDNDGDEYTTSSLTLLSASEVFVRLRFCLEISQSFSMLPTGDCDWRKVWFSRVSTTISCWSRCTVFSNWSNLERLFSRLFKAAILFLSKRFRFLSEALCWVVKVLSSASRSSCCTCVAKSLNVIARLRLCLRPAPGFCGLRRVTLLMVGFIIVKFTLVCVMLFRKSCGLSFSSNTFTR